MAGFFCRHCGKLAAGYASSCPACGAFGALVQGSPKDGGWIRTSGGADLIEDVEVKDVDRVKTGTRELDRVLAGGFATDGAYILSGSPGAGKSTLLLQVMVDLADAEVLPAQNEGETSEPWRILIVAAEETKGQIAGRFRRLVQDVKLSRKLDLRLANQSDVLEVEKLVAEHDPDVVIVDSIQAVTMNGLDSPAGAVTTVKACAMYLSGLCKARKVCLIMVAHVTKDDELAGPKTFEHLVDGVLHLSNEEPFRVLRASKHRFGPTSEVGIFRMGPRGMESVENPSELLLAAHLEGVPGSVVGVMSEAEGDGAARALLVEVQALRRPGALGEGASARLSVTGLDGGRVRTAVAVLEERVGFGLRGGEIFAQVAGGVRARDPGLDLPAALAVLSATLGQDLPEGFCAFGEIGLAGEVRPPRNVEGRLRSALAMKVLEIMGPPLGKDLRGILDAANAEIEEEDDRAQYTEVRSVAEACEVLQWDVAPPKAKRTRRKKKS